MIDLSSVEQRFPVDYPPDSGEFVGRVDLARIAGEAGYAAISGYFCDNLVYHKNVTDGLYVRSHEKRVEIAVAKAVRRIRYDASLILELPNAIDLL